MTTLPEPYQQYAAPAGQPLGVPAVIQPAASQSLGVPEGMRVIGYTRDLDRDLLVPVYGPQYQPAERTPPRDLTPQKLLDPMAQRMIGAGIGGGAAAAGIGYGLGQVLSGVAAVGSGALFWLAVILLAAKLPRAGQRSGDTYNVTNHTRWFGKSTITKR